MTRFLSKISHVANEHDHDELLPIRNLFAKFVATNQNCMLKVTGINTIFIDIDNTLWHFDRNSDLALHETFTTHQCQLWCNDYAMFHDSYESHNQRLWQFYNQGMVAKEVLVVKRFEQAIRECGRRGNSGELAALMNATYLERLIMHHELVPGAIELLEYLHGKGYQINTLSNGFKGVQEKKLEAGGMNRYITHTILSEDCGITKPRQGIYDYAQQVTGCEPQSTVMIGDDPSTDIAGALAAGWKTIYFNINGAPCPTAHHTVGSLLEIKKLL